MADDVPIAAFSSFGTASRIYDTAEAVVRRFAFADGAAAGQPARTRSRRSGAEIAAESDIDVSGILSEHLNVLAIRAKLGPCRQRDWIHADGVVANRRHL